MNTNGASPSGFSNGPTPNATPTGTTPNGTAPRLVRRAAKADPLRPRNKKPVRRQLNEPNPSVHVNRPNTAQPLPAKNGAVTGMGRGAAPQPAPPQMSTQITHGGWTHPPKGDFQDFPLVTTKRQLKEALKYHVLRFNSSKEVDPTNPNQFLRPVSLHRRNPQQQPAGKFKDEDTVMGETMDDKEREKYEIAKLEKEEKRAAELAQIAPSLSTAPKKNAASYKLGKTTQVRHVNLNEQDQKESNNRYEEALPWHLEDAENSQTWMGIHEAALSESHVALLQKDGKYHMIPVEKWYKFTSKGHFKTMTTEEAEAQMNKKVKEPRWVMEQDAKFKEAREQNMSSRSKLFTVKGESVRTKNANKSEQNDMDDLDYEDNDFQDDEEHVTLEREQGEDEKEASDRIKRDQKAANLFGEADELAADKELEDEEREAENSKAIGRELQKALVKREKNQIYEDDDNYFSSSDEESEDKTKVKEEKKKEDEAKVKPKTEPKAASGASTKGTNTPLGRPPKNPDTKKSNLKRAGSPNLSASEASGTESRKKHKAKHPTQASGQPSSSQARNGQGEDVEMPDAAGPKKPSIKLRVNGKSPPGSRAGSPLPNSGRAGSAAGSRAGSPQAGNTTAIKTPASTKPLDITGPQIRARLLEQDGLAISDLLASFKVRSYSPQAQKDFIGVVRDVSVMGPDKKLRAKPV